jgi:hypothetical protein
MSEPTDKEFKKFIEQEVRRFKDLTKQCVKDAKELRCKEAELAKQRKQTADQKKSLKLILNQKLKLEKEYRSEAEELADRVNRMLKDYKPVETDENRMAKWYQDILAKESGLDLGRDVKLWGDVSFEKKEVQIILKGKF